MHPGVVDTNFSSYADEATQKISAQNTMGLRVPAEQGADTLIWLATDPAAGSQTGGYYYNRQPVAMHKQALDDAETERLWTETEGIIARFKS